MASRAPRPAKHNFYNGVYFGTLKNGKCHGKGVFFWDSGEFYFGEWELNKMHGEGIFFFAYGGVIKGQFYKSKINGAAILKFPNGDVYEGFWRHGKLDGKCFKYFLHDRTWALCIYENGLYRSCLNRGKGTPNINFEEKLTDNIEVDSSINTGVHISMVPFMDGGKYYGSIQDENADGLGFTSHPTGAYDAGFYENGVIDGLGRISFPGGNFYDGEMKEGQFEGEGFFYKKDTNRWIFGKFKEGQCVSVLEKGSGVPFEEICAWKGRRRRGNSQPFYILNNMFFVPVIADSKDKKGKKKTQRFVGLKRAPSVTNDSQFITDINQVLQSTPDPNLGSIESQYESQNSPASRLLLPTSPTQAQHTFNTGEMSNKSEANDAKALAARVQDNIEKNWDFFTTSAAQQQATEEPVSKGSPPPGARKLNQAQMQQQPQRQFGRSSTYQEPEAPKTLSTQKSAGSLLKGKTMTLERQKTGPVESVYTAALKTTKMKESSASGQSTGKSAGKSPLNQDFSGEPQQQPEKKPSRKSGSSTGSLGILRDKKGTSPQNKTQNKISSREFLNNAGVNEDTLELDFRNDYNTHSLEEAGGFGETPSNDTGHPGQGGKSPAFQYWQRSETPNEEDQLFGPSKSYGQTLNREDQVHGRFGSISSVNSHQPNRPHLFEGARESSLIDLGFGGGRRSTGDEEDVKEQEEGGKKKLALRNGGGEEDDDEEEENSAIQERREEEEFTPKASTKRSMKFGNKGLSSVGERSLSQETSPSVKSKRLLVDKRRTEESEGGKQEGGQHTGGLSHRKWLDEFEGQHEELEKSGKIDSSFNSPEKSVSSPEKILRSARSVERILDLQKTPGPLTGDDEDSRREGREANKSDLFGQGKEIVSPLVKREMETEEDEDVIIKRIEENLLLIGKEKKSPVPPLVGPGAEDEFREHLHKRMKSGQKQQAGENEKAMEAEEQSGNLQEKVQNEEVKHRSLGHLDEDNSAKIVTFGRIIVPSDREFALENEKKGQGEGGDSSLNKSRVSKASKASKDISQEEIKENKEAEDEEEIHKDIINEAAEEVLLSSQRKREEDEKGVKSKLIIKGESGADAKDEFTGGLNTLQALEQRQKEYEEEASKGALPTSLEGIEGEGKEELEMDDIGTIKETEEGIQKIKDTEEDNQESIDRDVTIEKMTEAERRRLMLSGDFTAEGNKTLERLGDEEAGDMEKILSQNMLKGSHGGSQEVKSKGSIGEGLKQEFPGVKKEMTYEFDDSEENRETAQVKAKEADEIQKEGQEGKTPRKGRKSKVLENGEVVEGDSEDSFRTANSPDNTEDKLNELEEEGDKAEDYIVEDFAQNQEEQEENIKRAGQRQGAGAGYIMIQDQNQEEGEEKGSSSQQERSVRKTFVDRAVGNDTEPNEEEEVQEAQPTEAHRVQHHKDTQSPELSARDLQEIRTKSYADVNVQFPEFIPEEHAQRNIGTQSPDPQSLASQPVQQRGHGNPGQEIAVDYSILENSQRKKSRYESDLQYGFAESYENNNNSRPHSRLASPFREEAGSPNNQKTSAVKKEGEVDGQVRSPIYIVSHVVSRYGSAPGSQDEIVDKISKTLSHEIDQIFNESLSASMKRLASIEPSSLPNSHRQRLPSSSKDLEPQIIIVSPDRVREDLEEALTRSAKPQEEHVSEQNEEATAQEKQIAEQILGGETIPEEQNEETTRLSQGREHQKSYEQAEENIEAVTALQGQGQDQSQEASKEKQQHPQEEEGGDHSFHHHDEASRHLSHDEVQSQRQGRFVNTAKSPQRETVESGFSSPIQSNQNTPLKNNSNLTISPGRFASPSGLRMAGSPTNIDYGIPNQKTDPLQARPPRSRKSASKNDVPISVNGQPSLSSPLRQVDLFSRTPEANTPTNRPENEVSTPVVASVEIIKEEESPKESKREETPLVNVTVAGELGGQNAPTISSFPGPITSNPLLTVPLYAYQDSANPNQSELDPTPTFTTTQNRPNRFSRNSPEAAPNDEETMKRSESPVPINILRQEYEAKTPEPKGTADDLNSSSSMIYKTPENEIRRIPENYEEIEDENFFTPVDSHRKRYMYPNTPLAKIEEGDEEGSVLNTASKLQQDTANSLVYSPFSTRRSPIRSSPGRHNSARQTILSMNNFKNSGKKFYNAPEIMKPDVRHSEDVIEPIGVGAKKFAKTTPKKFDNHYLTTSPNKQGYRLGSPH